MSGMNKSDANAQNHGPNDPYSHLDECGAAPVDGRVKMIVDAEEEQRYPAE